MAKHEPVEVNPKELKRANEMWGGFTELMKWSVIVTFAILAIMALVFIR